MAWFNRSCCALLEYEKILVRINGYIVSASILTNKPFGSIFRTMNWWSYATCELGSVYTIKWQTATEVYDFNDTATYDMTYHYDGGYNWEIGRNDHNTNNGVCICSDCNVIYRKYSNASQLTFFLGGEFTNKHRMLQTIMDMIQLTKKVHADNNKHVALRGRPALKNNTGRTDRFR